MAAENLALLVASYPDAETASLDYQQLRDAEGSHELDIVGSVVLGRGSDGKVTVKESGGGQTGSGALVGGGAGLVVGLFAPPFLLATAIGTGVGAAVGHLVKKHDERKMGVDVDEYLPPGSSAIVVVLDDQHLDHVHEALTRTDKRIAEPIDPGDYDTIRKALSVTSSGASDVIDA